MTKLLNLDQLNAKEVREVQIGGTMYQIKEMSVEDFIETTRVAEEMEKEQSYAKQLQATVKLIKRAIPNIEESLLMRLSLDQLRALTAFIRGEDPTKIVEEVTAQEGAEGNA
jgi:uncharacterized protein with von Willebrand factor type A (vWA) domain